MNVEHIFEIMGGRAKVMEITQLTKGRLSQWVKSGEIPRAWLLLFHEKRPDAIPYPKTRKPLTSNQRTRRASGRAIRQEG